MGYALFLAIAICGLVIIELMAHDDFPEEQIPIPLVLMLAFAYSVVVGVGAALGAVLSPVVAIKRSYWSGFFLAGVILGGTSLLLSIFTGLVEIGARSLGATCLAGFVLAIAMRAIGLTLGWARPWYAPGMCQACGYNLRETPAGGSCPECGEVAKEPVASRS